MQAESASVPTAAAPDPVSVEQVLQTIQSALSVEQAPRSQAEGLLKSWEADASPGFLSSLLRIVEQSAAVDEARTRVGGGRAG